MRDPARHAAVSALCAVDAGGYSNLVLKKLPAALSARDTAFCTVIVYGTLSRRRTLDYILDGCLKKPIGKLDAEVRAILRSGLYQALWLDSVPAAAAVDESVALAREFRKSSAAGLVNAVLRRAVQTDLNALENQPDGVRWSLSDSLAALVRRQYGARADEIFRAWSVPARQYLRVNTLRTDVTAALAALAAEGAQCAPCEPDGALIVKSGFSPRGVAFTTGLVRPQSRWSQTAAAALGATAGQRIFDMCAAPGGKSLTLAQLMGDSGEVLAMDTNEKRLSLISAAAQREGVRSVRVRVNDAAVYDPDLGEADGVLCDVPCSGLGVVAAKPELRYRDFDSLDELTRLQSAILATSARYVRRGGRLVYSTCTINRQENEDITAGFLASSKDFRELPGGCVHFPDESGEQGFYIALFERVW